MTSANPFENATIDDVCIAIDADTDRSARARARSIAWGKSVARLDVEDFFAAATNFTFDHDDLPPL